MKAKLYTNSGGCIAFVRDRKHMKKAFFALGIASFTIISDCHPVPVLDYRATDLNQYLQEQYNKTHADALLRALVRNRPDNFFEQPEHLQWLNGSPIKKATQLIDEYKADIQTLDENGCTVIMDAIRMGKPKMCAFLLTRDPEAILRDYSPRHYRWKKSGDLLWYAQEWLRITTNTIASLEARHASAARLKIKKNLIKRRRAVIEVIQCSPIIKERKDVATIVDNHLMPVLSAMVAGYAVPLCAVTKQ